MCFPPPYESRRMVKDMELLHLVHKQYQRALEEGLLQHVRRGIDKDDPSGNGWTDDPDPPMQQVNQMRMQMTLLLHAHKCSLIPRATECPVLLCRRMQDVIKHLASCSQENCHLLYCVTAREVLWHYKTCENTNCRICLPFRNNLINY